jgi:peptide/nickel transport system permease protein
MTDAALPESISLEEPAAGATPRGSLRATFARLFEDRLAVVGFGLVLLTAVAAIAAPWIAPQNPYDLASLDILDGGLAPLSQSMSGKTYWLGTDEQGRDMLSAIIYGLRVSLYVAGLATLIAVAVGLAAGISAAYFGRFVDTTIMRIADLQLGFPSILIALILLAVLGRGVDKVILALVMTQWAYYARVVRGSALVENAKDYVAAARCLALSNGRIMARHLLPNCLPPLIVVATVQVAHAISLEATLSFLGVGVPITEPSLGLLISNGYDYLLSGRYWVAVFPGIALLLIIVGVNLVGDRLRDILNPRLQK